MDYKEKIKSEICLVIYKNGWGIPKDSIIALRKDDYYYRVFYYINGQIFICDIEIYYIEIDYIEIDDFIIFNNEINEYYKTELDGLDYRFNIVWKNIKNERVSYLYKENDTNYILHSVSSVTVFDDENIPDYTMVNFKLIDEL